MDKIKKDIRSTMKNTIGLLRLRNKCLKEIMSTMPNEKKEYYNLFIEEIIYQYSGPEIERADFSPIIDN